MRRNKIFRQLTRIRRVVALALVAGAGLAPSAPAQEFPFERMGKTAEKSLVIVEVTVALSFGAETHEAKGRALGVVVGSDGLIITHGGLVEGQSDLGGMFRAQAAPEVRKLTVALMSGKRYDAEWLGVDRFTGVGFLRVTNGKRALLTPLAFSSRAKLNVGEWVAIYSLLPEYVAPPLAADIGMISARLMKPEPSALVVGFSSEQLHSVVFDTSGEAIGILSEIADPGDAGGFSSEDFYAALGGEMYSLLGILDADRLGKLIASPPQKGVKSRGWLGVSFQAMTKEMAQYWNLTLPGGVIVNEVIAESPAQAAGLQVGDILVTMNGAPITIDNEQNLTLFSRQISESGAGMGVEFGLMRKSPDGSFHGETTLVTLAGAPITSAEANVYADSVFAFKARDLVFSDYFANNLTPGEFTGALVIEVGSGGWSELGGLEPGDIIQLINGGEITDANSVGVAMRGAAEKKAAEVIFFIWRDNKTLFVNIKPNW